MSLICTLLTLYSLVVFGRVLFSWIPVTPGTGLAQVNSVLVRATEPLLGPLRSALPPLRLGGAAIDLSPIVLLLGLRVLQGFIC